LAVAKTEAIKKRNSKTDQRNKKLWKKNGPNSEQQTAKKVGSNEFPPPEPKRGESDGPEDKRWVVHLGQAGD